MYVCMYVMYVCMSVIFEWQTNDKRNGKGTYVFSNGSKYTGESTYSLFIYYEYMYVCMYLCMYALYALQSGHWTDNDIDVKGRFDFANGSFYRGMLSMYVCMYVRQYVLYVCVCICLYHVLYSYTIVFCFFRAIQKV